MSRVDAVVKNRAQDLDLERLLRPAPPVAMVRRFLRGWNFAELDDLWLRRLGVQTIRVNGDVL